MCFGRGIHEGISGERGARLRLLLCFDLGMTECPDGRWKDGHLISSFIKKSQADRLAYGN